MGNPRAKRRPALRRVLLRMACILLAAPLAHQVLAQSLGTAEAPPTFWDGPPSGLPLEDAQRITLGVSVANDSNFFRDPGLLRDAQSNTTTTSYLGLRIDKPYGQQRFFLDATATAYRYDKFDYLDFNGFDYRAAWYWSLTPRLTGTISAAQTMAPTQFQDTITRQSDVTTTENYVFNLDGWLFGGWHVLLGVSQVSTTSEQAVLGNVPDYDELRSEVGVRYLFGSGSEIAAVRRRIDGDQDSRLISNVIVVNTENYREDQSELRGTWNLSPQSVLTGRVTYLDRQYEQTPQNDFYGTAGELGYAWRPTSKLNLRLAATRSISPWQSLSSNYKVSNTFLIAPNWQATARTTLYMAFQRTNDDYPSSSTALPERKDTIDIAALGVNWLALRYLSVGAGVQYQQRSSNDPLVEYDNTIARISATMKF